MTLIKKASDNLNVDQKGFSHCKGVYSTDIEILIVE